ncbi:type 1 glutamine amidotransferase [Mucilaginibacter conchicola]|uniref:Type 1 glutamine amidotransferase n=1 Tax=Mucilaginibacter conchicola TaxID=2303333 RepID=A0A372NMZ7_9SPHI|nr:type 1 glutamine amidotransferase [Mucilaginibacter conchicola]RFZ90228.1 type 1 glutamine amidotransferase [Mucilaginibacter conchicola]
MTIHILQHVYFEGPGFIAKWAEQNSCEVTYTRLYEPGHHFPNLSKLHALVIMGGPMDVFAEHDYYWLHTEKIFIEDCIQAGKKVLGICLGAQLAAHCLGAMVSTAPNREIGWYPVKLLKMLFICPGSVLCSKIRRRCSTGMLINFRFPTADLSCFVLKLTKIRLFFLATTCSGYNFTWR